MHPIVDDGMGRSITRLGPDESTPLENTSVDLRDSLVQVGLIGSEGGEHFALVVLARRQHVCHLAPHELAGHSASVYYASHARRPNGTSGHLPRIRALVFAC